MSPLIIHIFPLKMRLLSGTCHSKAAKMEQTHELFLREQGDDIYELMPCSLIIEVFLCVSYTTDLPERPHILPLPYLSTASWNTYAIYRGFKWPTPSYVVMFCLCTEQSEVWDTPRNASQIYKSNHSLLGFPRAFRQKVNGLIYTSEIIRVVL